MDNPSIISLVVPTYNEAENILPLLQNVHAALTNLPHEVIVVDDNSPDGTSRRVEEFAASHSWVRLIRRIEKKGLSSAVLDGFEAARGEIVGVMDADLSHDEMILPRLIKAVQDGADIAVGSRRMKGGGATAWPWYRRLTSNVATGLAKMLLDLPLTDPMSGYFVMRRSVYEQCKLRLRPAGYKILIEICRRSPAAHVQEIPFIFKDRKQGYSKLSAGVIRDYLQMLVMLKLDGSAQALRYRYHTGRYKKVKRWLKLGVLLDIGCGQPCESMPDGSFLRYVGHGTGVDIKPCTGPFTFVQGSVTDLPFEKAAFDNVVAMEVLEHVTDPHRAFSEIRRVLQDDGRVVISVPEETWLWEKIWTFWEKTFGYLWHDTHTGTMAPEKWIAILGEYFVIEAEQRHWYFDRIFRLHKRFP